MQKEQYTDSIRDQTLRALWSLKNVMACIPEDLWNRVYCEVPLWKHLYHTLHSLDRWFINPRDYEEPDFHVKDLNNLDVQSASGLSRTQMEHYFLKIETKIHAYLDDLSDAMLLSRPENCELTRFALILGQHRHLHSHMGMLMGFIIEHTGKWPRVVGLEGDIPTGAYEPFF